MRCPVCGIRFRTIRLLASHRRRIARCVDPTGRAIKRLSRSVYDAAHPEKVQQQRDHQRERKRRLRRSAATETCPVCGEQFAALNGHRARRRPARDGTRVVNPCAYSEADRAEIREKRRIRSTENMRVKRSGGTREEYNARRATSPERRREIGAAARRRWEERHPERSKEIKRAANARQRERLRRVRDERRQRELAAAAQLKAWKRLVARILRPIKVKRVPLSMEAVRERGRRRYRRAAGWPEHLVGAPAGTRRAPLPVRRSPSVPPELPAWYVGHPLYAAARAALRGYELEELARGDMDSHAADLVGAYVLATLDGQDPLAALAAARRRYNKDRAVLVYGLDRVDDLRR